MTSSSAFSTVRDGLSKSFQQLDQVRQQMDRTNGGLSSIATSINTVTSRTKDTQTQASLRDIAARVLDVQRLQSNGLASIRENVIEPAHSYMETLTDVEKKLKLNVVA